MQDTSSHQTQIDLLIVGGTVLTMDSENRIIENGAIAIQSDSIVAIGTVEALAQTFVATRTLDAHRMAVMPGLIDTYGHAGHGLVKGILHPKLGWPNNQLYFHSTSAEWWYAEGLLSALERLRFGVTCGFSVIGATPARVDSPVFTERQAQAVQEVGIRGVLGVGPPDPFVHHLTEPWSGTIWHGEESKSNPFTFQDAFANTVDLIRTLNNTADGRIRMALHYPYLLGRETEHPLFGFRYAADDIRAILDGSLKIREAAQQHGVILHSHAFQGAVRFAVKNFGRRIVEELLGRDVVLAHCNGLLEDEVQLLGERGVSIAVVPMTQENVLYGWCPAIELLRAGANVTISTDGTAPYSSYDLFKDISRAIYAQCMRFGDENVLPAGKALRMVTIDAARALGLDQMIGSLEVGKRADVILVDLNRPHLTPTTMLPHQLAFYANGNDVDTVIVNGMILMEHRHVKTVDVQSILEMARIESDRAFRRLDIAPFLQIDPSFWQVPS